MGAGAAHKVDKGFMFSARMRPVKPEACAGDVLCLLLRGGGGLTASLDSSDELHTLRWRHVATAICEVAEREETRESTQDRISVISLSRLVPR